MADQLGPPAPSASLACIRGGRGRFFNAADPAGKPAVPAASRDGFLRRIAHRFWFQSYGR